MWKSYPGNPWGYRGDHPAWGPLPWAAVRYSFLLMESWSRRRRSAGGVVFVPMRPGGP
jgi:hypothetical protein